MTLFKMECLKLKRSKLWLPLLLIPLFAVIFGSLNYAGNRNILTHGWLSLYTQVALFYGMVFYPALVGIICANLWHIEHKRNTLKLLLASHHSLWHQVYAKSLLAFFCSFIVHFYFIFLFIISGTLLHFSMQVPLALLAYSFISVIFILPLIACQNFLSLCIKSFAPPIFFSILLGLLGLLTVAQSRISFIQYVFAFSKLTLTLNNLRSFQLGISSTEWLSMCCFSLIFTLFFTWLQIRQLQQLRK